MSLEVFLAVLAAAFMHAAWSAALKGDQDPRAASFAMALAHAPLAAPVILLAPPLAPAAWPFLAASLVAHLAYFQMLTEAYRRADLGLVYPLSRGAAPAIAAAAGTALGLEAPGPHAWLALGLILAGAVALALPAWRGGRDSRLAIILAVLTAACTAAYTLIDGHGARASGAVVTYTAWQMCLTGLANGTCFALTGGRALIRAARARWRLGLTGGAVAGGAYGVVLWAMTHAPIAEVAALREASIAFAAVIAVMVLRERADMARITGAGLILAGAASLRLA